MPSRKQMVSPGSIATNEACAKDRTSKLSVASPVFVDSHYLAPLSGLFARAALSRS